MEIFSTTTIDRTNMNGTNLVEDEHQLDGQVLLHHTQKINYHRGVLLLLLLFEIITVVIIKTRDIFFNINNK